MSPGAGIDLTLLADTLRVYPGFQDLAVDELLELPFAGAMHHHVRIGRRGWIARVPIGAPSLSHARAGGKAEAAAYRRLAPAGRTPRLRVALRPRPEAPLGVLVIQEIVGRPARVPDDMTAIAQALADVHRLEAATPDAWPPIPADPDPVRSRIAVVRSQLARLAGAPLDADVHAALIEELVGSSRVDLQACKLEYSIVSPK